MNLYLIVPAALILSFAVGIGVVEEIRGRKAVAAAPAKTDLKIELVIGDITAERVDAIVNAAKPSLLGGGGVDGAIHEAGGPAILAECKMLRADLPADGLSVGQAVVTTAGYLDAQYVIHTVGPDRRIGQTDPAMLRSCYTEALDAADTYHARTVAFPLISSGVYGWPIADAVTQALTALLAADTQVQVARLVFFDDASYCIAKSIYEEMTR